MPLDPTTEVALVLLQVTGLVLPIVFIALRPYYQAAIVNPSDPVTREAKTPSKEALKSAANDEDGSGNIRWDTAPSVIYAGGAAIGFLLLSILMSGVVVLSAFTDDLLLVSSIGALLLGLMSLGVLYYLIRREFFKELEFV